MRRILALLLTIGAIQIVTIAPVQAYAPVTIVHTEQVKVGPDQITVGFSRWPIRAMQSLDFTFDVSGGNRGKSGEVAMVAPDGSLAGESPLSPHPRKREVWGIDVQSLPSEGLWSIRFTVIGPTGKNEGSLTGVTVLSQPGPPFALSWLVAGLPLLLVAACIVVASRRTRQERDQFLPV
jgi:hypothetical protein